MYYMYPLFYLNIFMVSKAVIIIPILQMEVLRLKQVWFGQGHSKGQD